MKGGLTVKGLPEASPEEVLARLDLGERLQIRLPRWQGLLTLGFGLVPAALFIPMFVELIGLYARYDGSLAEDAMMVVVFLLLLFMTGMFLLMIHLGLRRLSWANVAWEIGPEGVVDRFRPGRTDVVQWREVLGADPVDGGIAVGVTPGALRPPSAIARLGARLFGRWMPEIGESQVVIGVPGPEQARDTLVTVIEARARRETGGRS